MILKIRLIEEGDLTKASIIHQEAFSRQNLSEKWLECNFNAFPRFLIFVAESNESIVGYIIWNQKSGFRPEVVLELEQIAVFSNFQGQGIGRLLIEGSLPMVKALLSENESILKHVVVTTRADNHAQRLYKSVLGAKVEATIENLYSSDEVFMVARHM